jgi:plasmid replication initiation protein
MKFSSELADFLKALKKVYAKIGLQDIGALQSRYGIRIFELVTSYMFLNGRNGYKHGEWYVQENIEEFRYLLGVPEGTYTDTHLFKQKVIEGPVREINEAGIGLEIKPEGVKEGRNLTAIRLNCKKQARKTPTKKRGRKKAVELPEENPKLVDQREEKELQHLKELYSAEFLELYTAELEKVPNFLKDKLLSEIAAEGAALLRLRKKYGIVK